MSVDAIATEHWDYSRYIRENFPNFFTKYMEKKKISLFTAFAIRLTSNLVFLPRTCCECCYGWKEEKGSCPLQAMFTLWGQLLSWHENSTENGFCSHENGDFGAVSLTDAPSHLIKVPEELFLMEYVMRALVMWLKIQKEMSKQSSQDWLGKKP